ncbi:hypothetical protein OROHE_007469 [Orobanche hederae]
MASSQTTSFTEKKKESIIDGRLFVQAVIVERVQTENDDVATMEHVVSRIKQTDLFNLGRQHSDLYDESLLEEFYREASVRFHSVKKGGDVAEIYATICGVEIRINRHLLDDVFSLPSSGLKMEELGSFGSEDLMSTFWCAFIRDSSDKKVHPSCHKKRFILPFVYLHDFSCRVVKTRTGKFEMCTNLCFRMMLVIMFGEPVNWCQIILKRLQEEVSKPLSQKKPFGLLLNNIFSCLDVPFSNTVKKIGPGKFIGGCKPTAYHKDIIPADRPSVFELPQSANPRDVTEKSKVVSSKKRKHTVSDKKSPPAVPEKKKKKIKKARKPKPTEVSATPVEAPTQENAEVAQPTAHNLQGATPTEEVVAAIYADPELMAAMMDDQLLAKVEGTGESTAFLESVVTSPIRVSTPIQDPSPHRVPSPVRDPSPIRVPTLVRNPSSKQAPIPVTDPKPTEIPIPVRSTYSTQIISDTLLSVQVEQAFERFVQWKSYRVPVYDLLYHWEDWEEEEKFILEITDISDIGLLIRWENSFCHELVTNFCIAQAEARLKGKTKSVDPSPSSPSDDSENDDDAFQAGLRMSREDAQNSEARSAQSSQGQGTSKDQSSPPPQEEATKEKIQEESVLPYQPEEVQYAEIFIPDESRAIPQEESVPLSDQADAERQQEESVPPNTKSRRLQCLKTNSQHMVEFIPEDRPMHPTHHVALLMLIGPQEQVARPESPRSKLRKERLDALGRHTVFIQDAVDALHKVGKALDWLNVSAIEKIGSVKSDVSNVANALQVLPQLLKVALANIQQQKKRILEKDQAKYNTFAARTAIAPKESGTKLTGHDKNLDDLSMSLQTLADNFSKIKGKQDDVMDLVHSINSHVSEINARKGEEESREGARRWRLQKEAKLNAI